jgi:hypothetical protein
MTANESGHLDDGVLAGFLDGDLAADERERAVAHLDVCPECREELRTVSALAQSYVESAPTAKPSRARTKWLLAAPALAASIAAVFLLRPVQRQPVVDGSQRVRAIPEGTGQIPVVSPSGRDASRSTIAFVWRSASVDMYTFTLLSESGAVLFRRETSDTTMAWPRDVQPALGAVYFWRVDGIAGGVIASTGAKRLRLDP